jgi:hypothetical protein
MFAFVSFSRISLLGILIFKGLTARRLYTLFGVKGLKMQSLDVLLYRLLDSLLF